MNEKRNFDKSVSELEREVVTLKCTIGGYKSKNKQLSEKILKLKALNEEGDRMYEERLSEVEELKKRIAENSRSSALLRATGDELRKELDKRTEENLELQKENQRYKDTVDDLTNLPDNMKKPWWKKIF